MQSETDKNLGKFPIVGRGVWANPNCHKRSVTVWFIPFSMNHCGNLIEILKSFWHKIFISLVITSPEAMHPHYIAIFPHLGWTMKMDVSSLVVEPHDASDTKDVQALNSISLVSKHG